VLAWNRVVDPRADTSSSMSAARACPTPAGAWLRVATPSREVSSRSSHRGRRRTRGGRVPAHIARRCVGRRGELRCRARQTYRSPVTLIAPSPPVNVSRHPWYARAGPRVCSVRRVASTSRTRASGQRDPAKRASARSTVGGPRRPWPRASPSLVRHRPLGHRRVESIAGPTSPRWILGGERERWLVRARCCP